MNDTAVQIIKSDGTQEPFDENKLKRSLTRAGAPDEIINDVLDNIRGELRSGITTQEIYRRAYALLRKYEHRVASRYSLRRALLALGPTGFPFEDFISELFRTLGHEVSTRVMVPGKCTTHELDVIAKKDGKTIGAELKFHNDITYRTDLKVALYVRARFDDLHTRHQMEPHSTTPLFDETWLVTNTKFTSQAIEYSLCAGLTLVGWNYPIDGNLQELIESANIHPLTCLNSLSNAHKRQLLEKGIVLCRSLKEEVPRLHELGLSERAIQSTLSEVDRLCANDTPYTMKRREEKRRDKRL